MNFFNRSPPLSAAKKEGGSDPGGGPTGSANVSPTRIPEKERSGKTGIMKFFTLSGGQQGSASIDRERAKEEEREGEKDREKKGGGELGNKRKRGRDEKGGGVIDLT